jgi:aryl-alcohol dehydrogenase-like predicted oxidoreductase
MSNSSRRNFIAAGLSLPVAGLARPQSPQLPAKKEAAGLSGGAKGQLEYRTLGKTGQKVTAVGFGCMITSDSSVIARAVDMGITYFDTARVYQSGNNERMVGSVLKGHRDKIVLSSKSPAKTGKEAAGHLDTSLKELGTDHLDIWYMHAHDDAAGITDDLVETWENAKRQGKIRFIGISTHNPNATVDRILQVSKFEVVLSTYNFAVGTANNKAFQRLHDAGIGLVAMKVMAPAARQFGFKSPGADRMKNPDTAAAALKWVLRHKLFATPIPSMTDNDQLEANYKAASQPFGAALKFASN